MGYSMVVRLGLGVLGGGLLGGGSHFLDPSYMKGPRSFPSRFDALAWAWGFDSLWPSAVNPGFDSLYPWCTKPGSASFPPQACAVEHSFHKPGTLDNQAPLNPTPQTPIPLHHVGSVTSKLHFFNFNPTHLSEC